MDKIHKFVHIKTNLSRSTNIERDKFDNKILESYIITNNALQAISSLTSICVNKNNSNKSFSLVGPYGSGKSSFVLYLSHLFTHSNNKLALKKLSPKLRKTIKLHLKDSFGYCNVSLSGAPDSLIKSFLKTLKASIKPYYKKLNLDSKKKCNYIDKLLALDEISTLETINIVREIRADIDQAGGKGLLIIIDELGKFLEYSARHESSDIFLLQVLAEEAYKTSKSNILLFVLLHQSFNQYGKNLSKELKNEWIKIQGRYQTLSFVDTIVEALPIIAQVFSQNIPNKPLQKIKKDIKYIAKQLKKHHLLPHSLDLSVISSLFIKCYPLHPITLLLLPILCQKIAQNERTLFNYLGSADPFALTEKIQNLVLGEFVYPGDIYDYFINGQNLSNDFQTARILSEAYSALNRAADATPAEINLLKTISLFNIANSSISASKQILELCDKNWIKNIDKLIDKSIITYRKFSREYRIWQGSDFNLTQAIDEQLAQLATTNIAQCINDNPIFLPIVAKRYSIENHSLFYFNPIFINVNQYQNTIAKDDKPRVIFCLNYNNQDKKIFKTKVVKYFSNKDVCVLLGSSDNIKEASKYRIALENIASQNSIIEQDPVIHREFNNYLIDAKQKEKYQLNQVLENPKNSIWYSRGKKERCYTKRDIQILLSKILKNIYPNSPIIKNELINRDNPSAQAHLGRKKLLLSLLANQDEENLAISGYPAEKSMYNSILKWSGMHTKKNDKWQITPPKDEKYLKVWREIDKFFTSAQEQAKSLSELDLLLTTEPFGIKRPVLPIFYIA